MNPAATATLSPRDRRFQRTRRAILDAALEIINADGVETLSIRQIAKEIDYSPAALYDYFKGKEDIIDAICLQVDQRLAHYLNQVPSTLPPGERLVEIGMNYLLFARENPREYAMLFKKSPSETDQHASHGSGFLILLEAVSAFLAALTTPDAELNREAFAYSCWAFVHGMASLSTQVAEVSKQNLEVVHRAALTRFVFGSPPTGTPAEITSKTLEGE